MKKILFALTAAAVLAACGQPYPDHSVVVNSRDALVQTAAGTVCGYIEDGIYTFKGIDYAKARRFEAPEDPDSWEGYEFQIAVSTHHMQFADFSLHPIFMGHFRLNQLTHEKIEFEQ